MSNATTELVQQLIRNECVNDGSRESGHETRNADLISSFFNNNAIEMQKIAAVPGRDNLLVTLRGKNPAAPKLLLLPHIDVVPAEPSDWEFDPFSGEIVDGYVIGRGAVDMYNVTGSMVIALSELINEGFAPEGDITLAAVADEEAGGNLGADFLMQNHFDLLSSDYVLSESGGTHMPVGDTTYLPVGVGEKGVHWFEIEIDGTPSHGSIPYGADNAIISTNDIISRFVNYKAPVQFVQDWELFLSALGLDKELVEKLSHEQEHDEALNHVHKPLAGVIHACAHNTFSPNKIIGGVKVNTVADKTKLTIDMRSIPGTTLDDVAEIIEDILGPHSDNVKINYLQNEEGTISATDTPLWKLLQDVSSSLVPGAKLLPTISTGGTDIRFLRNSGAIGYGAALFDSGDTTFEGHLSMFHGRNEKVSTKSLELTTTLYKETIKNFGDYVTV